MIKTTYSPFFPKYSPWKNVCRRTPMFPLEVFRTKRSQERLKKYLLNVYLISLITIINI
jgi:hypothetical protein